MYVAEKKRNSYVKLLLNNVICQLPVYHKCRHKILRIVFRKLFTYKKNLFSLIIYLIKLYFALKIIYINLRHSKYYTWIMNSHYIVPKISLVYTDIESRKKKIIQKLRQSWFKELTKPFVKNFSSNVS